MKEKKSILIARLELWYYENYVILYRLLWKGES